MRLLCVPAALLSLIASAHFTQAAVAIYTKNTQVTVSIELEDTSDYGLQNRTLARRGGGGGSGCANPCGWYGQVCCKSGETCYTDANNQAACSAAGAVVATTTVAAQQPTGAGSWQYYTSTWVDTVTRTSVWSSWVPATTAVAAATCSPNYANGESECGPICCAGNQYCYATGTCRAIAGYTTEGVSASAPARGTSVTGVIITATISPTTTLPFSTPATTGAAGTNGTVLASGGGGLSGGAIAGIVIGVIAGIILLLLICLACCLKAGFDSLLALFGIGKRRDRRRSRIVEEEIIEHRRHGSAAASAEGRRWYGSGYDRPSRPPPSRRSSQRRTGRFGGLGAVTAGLGGLALALGLKRRADRRRREEEKSDASYSYSYYGSSYYDSSSSGGGSADRTRRSTRIVRSGSRSRR